MWQTQQRARWYSLCSCHLYTRKTTLLRYASVSFFVALFLSKLNIVPQKKKTTLSGYEGLFCSLVPVVGLEPTRMISPQDFESSASASFTTPAQVIIYHIQFNLASIFFKKYQENEAVYRQIKNYISFFTEAPAHFKTKNTQIKNLSVLHFLVF